MNFLDLKIEPSSKLTYEEQAILDLYPEKSTEEMIQILEDSIEASDSIWEKNIFSELLEKLQIRLKAESTN